MKLIADYRPILAIYRQNISVKQILKLVRSENWKQYRYRHIGRTLITRSVNNHLNVNSVSNTVNIEKQAYLKM